MKSFDLEAVFGNGMAYWLQGSGVGISFLQHLGLVLGTLWIACYGVRVLRFSSGLAWILLLYIYLCRAFLVPMFIGETKLDRALIGLELFVVGMTAGFLGMKDQARWYVTATRYWFVLPFVGCLLWDPSWHVRFDEESHTDPFTAARVHLSEALCIIAFLVAGEFLYDPAIMTEDGCTWVCDWALLVFLVHKAVHIAIPKPCNWIVLVALLPLCWWYKHNAQKSQSVRQEQPSAGATGTDTGATGASGS